MKKVVPLLIVVVVCLFSGCNADLDNRKPAVNIQAPDRHAGYFKIAGVSPETGSRYFVLDTREELPQVLAVPAVVNGISVESVLLDGFNEDIAIGNRVRRIVVPDSVCEVVFETTPFGDGFRNLESIEVSSGNRKFAGVSGVLYSKDLKTLYKVPNGIVNGYRIPGSVTHLGLAFVGNVSLRETVIPDSVTDISGGCFSGCNGLERIEISASVSELENGTFAGCSSLKEIKIPDSVTSIMYAFAGCTSLSRIIYGGTLSQWNWILMASDLNEVIPSGCIIECTDGEMDFDTWWQTRHGNKAWY